MGGLDGSSPVWNIFAFSAMVNEVETLLLPAMTLSTDPLTKCEGWIPTLVDLRKASDFSSAL